MHERANRREREAEVYTSDCLETCKLSEEVISHTGGDKDENENGLNIAADVAGLVKLGIRETEV